MTVDSDLNLTGAAFELAHAGYAEMPDPGREQEHEAIGSDSASLHDAADQRGDKQPKVIVRQYTDAEGKRAAANEAVTLSRAARDYASATAGDMRITTACAAKIATAT